MYATILLESPLQRFTDNKARVAVNGKTINACIADLIKQYPGVKHMIFESNGAFHPYVTIFVDKEMVNRKNYGDPIKDGAVLQVLYVVAGG